MDIHPEDRRGNAFCQVLASVDAAEAQQPAIVGSLKQACYKAASETPLLIISLTASVLCVLLLVRPAFILKFEQDQRRPWRGCTRISWYSVFSTLMLVAFVPFLLRFVTIRCAP